MSVRDFRRANEARDAGSMLVVPFLCERREMEAVSGPHGASVPALVLLSALLWLVIFMAPLLLLLVLVVCALVLVFWRIRDGWAERGSMAPWMFRRGACPPSVLVMLVLALGLASWFGFGALLFWWLGGDAQP